MAHKIKLFFTTTDGCRERMEFPSVGTAKAEVKRWCGPFEIGSSYAVSFDGVVKFTIIEGCTYEELR